MIGNVLCLWNYADFVATSFCSLLLCDSHPECKHIFQNHWCISRNWSCKLIFLLFMLSRWKHRRICQLSMSDPAGVCEDVHTTFHGTNSLKCRNKSLGKLTHEYSKKPVCSMCLQFTFKLNITFISFFFALQIFLCRIYTIIYRIVENMYSLYKTASGHLKISMYVTIVVFEWIVCMVIVWWSFDFKTVFFFLQQLSKLNSDLHDLCCFCWGSKSQIRLFWLQQ